MIRNTVKSRNICVCLRINFDFNLIIKKTKNYLQIYFNIKLLK